MLRKIELIGALGRKFSPEYKLDVNSVGEAIRALAVQVKGFKEYLEQGEGSRQHYRILVNGKSYTNIAEELHMNSDGGIQIVPVESGAGGDGLVGTLIGVALIGVAIWNPLGWVAATQWAVAAAGAGLALGGIIGSMVKTPVTPQVKESREDRSYLFNGAVNTVQQGQPIPIGYGRLRIGSQVVSVSVSNAQVPVN